MSRADGNGGTPAGSDTRVTEGPWTKIGVIGTILGVLITAVALLPKPGSATSTPGPSVTPTPQFTVPATATPTQPYTTPPNPRPNQTHRTVPGVDDPNPGQQPSPGPSLNVTPLVVNLGNNVAIDGAGFEAGAGLHIRLFHDNSISYELGRNIVADESGHFTLAGPVSNPGWCGSGIVAAFVESGSSIDVPALSEAIATARIGIRC